MPAVRRRRIAAVLVTVAAAATVLAVGSPPPAAAATPQAMVVDSFPVDVHAGGGREVGTEEALESFTMIGATYESTTPDAGRVRVLVDGEWSAWFRLVGAGEDADHGPDAGTGEGDRPASDPVWVGDGTGFQLSLPADAADVTVHLVREGHAGEDSSETESARETAPETGYTIPSVRPRSAWGAGPYHGTVDVADGLQRAIIHHTVNGNGYSASQVPSMLRSIQAYHQGARGWDDIGYNFVIDRFGTVWEARARSLYEPVIGAHARDHNTGSVGVAYLGDGTSTGLSSTAVSRLGRFLGWKMSLHGARPTRGNIIGHRDVGQTSCPGNTIYGQLGSIRTSAIDQSPPLGPFFDVPNTNPQAPVLQWARDSDVLDKLRDGTFHPNADLTKGDAIYWLWRLAGRQPGVPHGFSDIPANAYYREAVRWGVMEGIVRPTPDGEFHAGRPVTREQEVVQLWRWADSSIVSVDHGYTDVPDGVASEEALDWADEFGLVDRPTFGRGHRMSRYDAAQLLFRMRRFDDVGRHHWAYGAVQWARFHVITSGFADHTFRPGTAVNRSQGVEWIWRTMDRPYSPTPPDNGFDDVPDGARYDHAVDWATEAGWVEGQDGSTTTFDPGGGLERGDAVAWLFAIAGRPATDHEHEFTDVPPELEDAVDWATEFNLVGGFPDGTYRPTDTISRGQFARMLFRLASHAAAWAVTPPTTGRF